VGSQSFKGLDRLALLLLALWPFMGGCSTWSMAVGAGATAATAASEERGLGRAVDDSRIGLAIQAKFLGNDAAMLAKVDVEVHEARVLLAGKVKTQESRIEAVRLAWQVDGVAEVINEIKLAEPVDTGQYLNDLWLAQELRTKILVDAKIRSVNYNIDCVGGTIYLMGVAQDQTELQRVIDHARDISYVRHVVSYVRLKNDPTRLVTPAANRPTAALP
jgi:osmotically-inducible protein OsmY